MYVLLMKKQSLTGHSASGPFVTLKIRLTSSQNLRSLSVWNQRPVVPSSGCLFKIAPLSKACIAGLGWYSL